MLPFGGRAPGDRLDLGQIWKANSLEHLVVDLEELGDEAAEEVAERVSVALVWNYDVLDQVMLKFRQVQESGSLLRSRHLLLLRRRILLLGLRKD